MFRKMFGLAFLTAISASSDCGSRASVARDAELRSPSALQARLLQPPRSQGGTESEAHVQRQSRPPLPEVNLAKILDGRSLLRCKQRRSRLGKLTILPNAKHALPKSQSNRRKATLAKSQAKITELEAAAVEAVDEAKQRADKLQTEYDEELARLVKTSDPVTHLRKSVREAF